jgi:DNA mismatch repair protein MutS2
VIVTTHQGQLKSLAQGRDGFYNGCMNFRNDTLEPDYRFVPGIPGSSFTLEIARRMDFPEDILARAQDLSGDSFRLDRMLEEVTSSRDELRSRLEELELRSRESRELLQSRLEDLERERRELETSREDILHEYRELERSINSRADSLLSQLARSVSPEERRELRERLREISRISGSESPASPIDSPDPHRDIETGDWVSVDGWSGIGRVEEVGEDHVAVTLGNLRLRKTPAEVRKVPPPEERPASAGWSSPVTAETELDLRGMSSEEAVDELDRALEDGLVAGIPFIRVIHGKGRGILMKAVVDMVRSDGRVETFRPGKPPEGGTGVTIVYIRQPGKRT